MEIECRWAEGRRDHLLDLAAELVKLDVDVIVAAGEGPARAAKRVTRTIPIVFVAGGDAVREGPRGERGPAGRQRDRPVGAVGGRDRGTAAEPARAGRARRRSRRRTLANPDSPSSAQVLGHLRATAGQAVEVRVRGAERGGDRAGLRRHRRGGDGRPARAAGCAVRNPRPPARRTCGREPAAGGVRRGDPSRKPGAMALHGDTAEVIRRTAAIVLRILGGSSPPHCPSSRSRAWS